MTDYINMETKTCVFGYGGIIIHNIGSIVVFKGIKPPQGVGTHLWLNGVKVGEWEYVGSKLSIYFKTTDEIKSILKLIKNVEDNHGGLFTFKDIAFDFTNYSHESIQILKAVIERARMSMILMLAC